MDDQEGMPPIGTKRLKASEMGQVMGNIREELDDSLVSRTADAIPQSSSLSLILSFFEWEYGALPFTRALAALMPTALLPDQRTTVLRFDAPALYLITG